MTGVLFGSWNPWLVIGMVGQLAFASRFAVQWIVSEREGRSVIPGAFWWLSLVGAVLLLAYALQRGDPVFIVGQLTGGFVYCRNIALRARAET